MNLNCLFSNKYGVNFFFRNGLKSWTGGVQYPGFKYYPRKPDEQDPPYEPTKLLMVQRVKPFHGNAYWLKRILRDIGLDGKTRDIAIVKNIPEMTARLYKIKHLIRIKPIQTPDGIPDDPSTGFLNENGVFKVTKYLNAERFEHTEDFQTDPARLDTDTLIKQSRDRWNNPW